MKEKIINIGFKLLLVGLVAFGVFTMWIDINTPSIAQIKTEMYKEQIQKQNDAKQMLALAKGDLNESTIKAQKIKNGLFTCFNTETNKSQTIDNVDGFEVASKDECMTSGSICLIKDNRTCTNNL